MHERLGYDPVNAVWTIFGDGFHVRSHSDLLRLRLEMTRELRHVGRNADVLVCLDGFVLEPAMAAEQGKLIRRIMDYWGLMVFRYGGTLATSTAIRVATLSNGITPRLFATREEALAALLHHRHGMQPAIRRSGT
jgi:hypothetical protein